MDKEFITYEQAVALKELGFDEPCLWFYANNGNDGFVNFLSNENGVVNKNNIVTAPLYQQAFRWFREKHGLNYVIEYHCEGYNLLVSKYYRNRYLTYEEAEDACLDKLIEIAKNK
jgi:hypothetical protein